MAKTLPNSNPAPAQSAPKAKAKPVKVRAIDVGYYDHKRRYEGDVFYIDGRTYDADVRVYQKGDVEGKPTGPVVHKKGEVVDFSSKWMELVTDKTPLKETGADQKLQREHDEILASRRPSGAPTGAANVLGDDD